MEDIINNKILNKDTIVLYMYYISNTIMFNEHVVVFLDAHSYRDFIFRRRYLAMNGYSNRMWAMHNDSHNGLAMH